MSEREGGRERVGGRDLLLRIKCPFCFRRDQSLVAQAIRKYLHQYSIPQREVVGKTAINQSHLSQHFTRGVPIKPAKRVKLYHWFEQDQLQRTGSMLEGLLVWCGYSSL